MYVENKGNGKEDFDRMLRQFTKMIKKNEIINEVKRREFYVAPSRKKILKRQESTRRKIRDAKKVQKKQQTDW